MPKLFDLLASQIYYEYYLAINENVMLDLIDSVLKDKTIVYWRHNDSSIVSFEKNGLIYINSNFLLEITNRIAEYIERDVSIFKSTNEQYTHFYYLILYSLFKIKDEEYIDCFLRQYPNLEL